MSTAALETEQTVALFERIDTLEDVAQRVDEGDRVKLQRVVREELAASPPVRPVAAARVLDLSEKTIRTWVAEGVLQRADTQSPRLLLDTNVLHAVANIGCMLWRTSSRSCGRQVRPEPCWMRFIGAWWTRPGSSGTT